MGRGALASFHAFVITICIGSFWEGSSPTGALAAEKTTKTHSQLSTEISELKVEVQRAQKDLGSAMTALTSVHAETQQIHTDLQSVRDSIATLEKSINAMSVSVQPKWWSHFVSALASIAVGLFSVLIYEWLRKPRLQVTVGDATSAAEQWRFLHVRVRNLPQYAWLRWGAARLPANSCQARIEIGPVQEAASSMAFTGRWITQPEPGFYLPEGGLQVDPRQVFVVPREDIPAGMDAQVAIAFKYTGQQACFGFNNENYLVPDLRVPTRELPLGQFRVRVIVTAGESVATGEFLLLNPSPELGNFELADA